MCAQRDKFDKTSLDEFAHEIVADVDVARKLSAYWILNKRHRPDYPHRFQLHSVADNQNHWGFHEDSEPPARLG